MEITVTGRGIEVTPAIKQYATDKVSKLPRYFDRVQQINVLIGKHDSHDFEAEILVDVEHHEDFVAKSSGSDLYGCIDQTVDKLERQLTDFKEKQRNHKGRTSMRG